MSRVAIDYLRSTLTARAINFRFVPKPYKGLLKIKRFPVRITGGIGDLIMGLRTVEGLENVGIPSIVFTKWPEIARLFTDVPCESDKVLKRSMPEVLLNLSTLAIFQFSNDFKGFRSSKLAELYLRNRHFFNTEKLTQIALEHPHLDQFLAEESERLGLNRITFPMACLGLSRDKKLWVNPRLKSPFNFKYITVHDGHDANNGFSGRATKNWSIASWKKFIEEFRKLRPDVKIVQLGGPNSRLIPGVDHDRVRVLTFAQSLQILSGSLCHVDGDSGLVHAQNALGGRSVVMFGPTPASFFGYEENKNLSSPYCGGCWWLKPDWNQTCPVGYEEPECMNSISPRSVVEAVAEVLNENR